MNAQARADLFAAFVPFDDYDTETCGLSSPGRKMQSPDFEDVLRFELAEEVRKLKHDHPMKPKKWPKDSLGKTSRKSQIRPAVLGAITEKPFLVEEIAEKTGFQRRSILDIISDLRKEGRLFVVRKNRDNTLLFSTVPPRGKFNEGLDVVKAVMSAEWRTTDRIRADVLSDEPDVTVGAVSARLSRLREQGFVQHKRELQGSYHRAFWRLA